MLSQLARQLLGEAETPRQALQHAERNRRQPVGACPECGMSLAASCGDPYCRGCGKPMPDELIRGEDELDESLTPLPVIETTKPVPCLMCPHCQQEIYEKHSYRHEGIDYHSDCKKPIKFPPTDWSKVSPEWREILGGPK